MTHHISERINFLIKERGISATELADGAGVSNATISKLRSPNYSGSVSFEVVQRISRYFDVPLHFFERKLSVKHPFVGMKFHDFALGSGAEIYKKYMLKSLGNETIYISNTIPDALKTRSILRAELGDDPFIPEYGDFMENIRNDHSIISQLMGSFFIDLRTMTSLTDRTGIYGGISKSDSDEQIAVIYNFFKAAFPRVHGYILDFQKNGISTAFVVNQKYGAQFAFGGYFEWESEYLGKTIHDKAVAAISNATSISAFLGTRGSDAQIG